MSPLLSLWCLLAATPLWDTVERTRQDQVLEALAPAQMLETRRLFGDLLRGAAHGEIPENARQRGAEVGLLLRIEEDRVILWGMEGSPHGVYVVRLGEAAPIVWQAPHSYFDMETGSLVAQLFEGGNARAAFFNQAHRNTAEDEEAPVDLAHLSSSVFQAATLGAATGIEDLLVVQVHGFRSRGGESAVVSRGSAFQPSRWESQAIDALVGVLPGDGAVLSGDELPQLAGRTNLQGRGLAGEARFLHLELSLPVRRALGRDAVLRQALGAAFSSLAEEQL